MFKKFYTKGYWLRLANNIESEKMKRVILLLFIPYKIDVEKYGINEDCFLKKDSYNYQTRKYCTTSLPYWIERAKNDDLPMGFPTWFYAAFPDVAKWTQTSEARVFLEPLFEENKDLLEDPSDGRLRVFIFKKMIDAFLISTSKKLEVSI